MILPLAHENQQSRRLPWITLLILLSNLVVFIITDRMNAALVADFGEKAQVAISFAQEHPYLHLSPPLERIGLPRDELPRVPTPRATIEEQQATLDAMCASLLEMRKHNAFEKLGYIPAKNNVAGIFTSMFVHQGWLHLIFNMWFLWLVGCNLEDAWGRLVFPLLYLGAGVVAVLAHRAAAPLSTVPLIGASGAVAGAMGAFTIRFATTKIRFVWFLFIKPIFFHARAYLMLPLWALGEVLSGWISPAQAGGTAHWAHVGGFAFGLVFALAFRLSGLDKKLDQAIESKVSFEQDPRITEASDLTSRGAPEAALALLEQLEREDGRKVEVQLELLRAATALRDQPRTMRAYARLIDLYLHDGEAAAALALFGEVEASSRAEALPALVRLRVARQLERDGAPVRAARVYAGIHGDVGRDEPGLQALIAHAELATHQGQKDEAARLYAAAQRSPVPHPHFDAIIARGLKAVAALPG